MALPFSRALVPALAAASLLLTGFGPFGAPGHPVTRDARPEPKVAGPRQPPSHFFWAAFRFYQVVVTPIDGPRCSHHPTCSLYAMQAVRERGTLPGLWIALDRTLRTDASSALRRFPIVEVGGVLRFDDPLDDATFWLKPPVLDPDAQEVP